MGNLGSHVLVSFRDMNVLNNALHISKRDHIIVKRDTLSLESFSFRASPSKERFTFSNFKIKLHSMFSINIVDASGSNTSIMNKVGGSRENWDDGVINIRRIIERHRSLARSGERVKRQIGREHG